MRLRSSTGRANAIPQKPCTESPISTGSLPAVGEVDDGLIHPGPDLVEIRFDGIVAYRQAGELVELCKPAIPWAPNGYLANGECIRDR